MCYGTCKYETYNGECESAANRKRKDAACYEVPEGDREVRVELYGTYDDCEAIVGEDSICSGTVQECVKALIKHYEV